MRNLIALFLLFSFISCKKEPVYGPLKLKDGQEVELYLDHRYASNQDITLKLPEKVDAGTYLQDFNEREPGYNYRVKAVFHYEDGIMDGPGYFFTLKNVISKEKYTGNESFEIELIVSYVPGGPVIRIGKQGNDYYFIPEKLQLTSADATIDAQLAEIYQNAVDIRANYQTGQRPKWKAIKATVVYDPQKFGKAYLVKQLKFIQ